MTRTAIYHATPNQLVEEPTMEKPVVDPEATILTNLGHQFNYDLHLESLRTIPVHESARSLWKDGQKLTEGVDYDVFEYEHLDPPFKAIPLPVKSEQSEDELWAEVIHYLINNPSLSYNTKISDLKQSFIISKR